MPTTYQSYPGAGDVESLLVGVGITVPTGFDTEAYVSAAVDEWEETTGWLPFLAAAQADPETPVYVSYLFDPPGPNRAGESRGGGRILQLRPGFVSVNEVRTGIDVDDEVGQLLTEGRDYRLKPYNAALAGKPYTQIELTYVLYGAPQSVKVSGEPGYCSVLKAEVWNAIRSLAASKFAEALREALSGGAEAIEWKDGEASERLSIELVAKYGLSWAASARDVMMRYARLA